MRPQYNLTAVYRMLFGQSSTKARASRRSGSARYRKINAHRTAGLSAPQSRHSHRFTPSVLVIRTRAGLASPQRD